MNRPALQLTLAGGVTAAFVCGMFWLCEAVATRATLAKELSERVVDIQQPDALTAKIDSLRHLSGFKVVVAGDSLIYGETMRQFGDQQWRSHTLPAMLQQKLQPRLAGRPLHVINLGINGALPGDIEQVARLLKGCEIDVFVFDVHLRPFSRDFAAEPQRLARPWLRDVVLGDSALRYDPKDKGIVSRIEARASDGLRTHWAPYRHRYAIQSEILDGDWAHSISHWRERLVAGKTPQPKVDLDILLLQMRDRLSSVDMKDDNPQVQALERTLKMLGQRRHQTIVFYAKENPALLFDVITQQRYHELCRQLKERIAAQAGKNCRVVTLGENLRPEHYLDFSHLNTTGYGILSDRIAAAVVLP